jgi:ankyrin repeat protein
MKRRWFEREGSGEMTLQDEIVEAVKADEMPRTQKLLKEDPTLVNTRTAEGSLVLTAAYYGAQNVLKILLDRNPALDIFEAATVGNTNRIQAILEAKPELANAVNHDGYTPLGLASFFGHETAVQSLLERGADINRVHKNREANTALDGAVAANQIGVVRLLLSKGAEVNCRAAGGFTPLHKAAFAGHEEMVRLLLAHGADVQAKDDKNRTPFAIATEKGHADLSDLLRPSDPSS